MMGKNLGHRQGQVTERYTHLANTSVKSSAARLAGSPRIVGVFVDWQGNAAVPKPTNSQFSYLSE